MRKKNIVAGNWKMNKTLQGEFRWLKLNEALANEKPNCDVIICSVYTGFYCLDFGERCKDRV